MQNIDVRFSATSNFAKVEADLAALRAEAAALSTTFNKASRAQAPALVDPMRWKVASKYIHTASGEFRNAAASSGLFTTQQIRATSETEKFTKALQKQKLSFGDMRRNWNIMKEVYRDQLRFQRMVAVSQGSDVAGRAVTDIAIPKSVPADLDTMRRKMGMFGQMASSAGTQVVNLGKNIQWSGRQLTVGFTYPMAMFGAAAGYMAYQVEDAFGSINKVYDVSAKAQQNEALRTQELGELRSKSMDMAAEAAKEYGSAIADTLTIEQQLAATGLTMADGLLETTKNVQRIAAIGDIDAGMTADMVVSLGTAFKLQGEDMTDTLNYMNAASNATSLSLQDIAEATPRAASAMSALGVSAKQMTVLLVSMREAGVDAAEGANALKSATGTILAPSPAALEFIEKVAGGKIAEGFENIAKSSGGNLFKAMQQMFELTAGMDKLQRQQILVKLFGKYQFNRVSAMLDNLGEAFMGTQNQARKAMDLMGQSSKENAEQAAKSLADMTQTTAGRFRAAWESLKIELAEMGKPFLEVANKALEAGTKIAKFFNGMDDWKKQAILAALALTALAGPAIMLAGLVMNLTGQFIKGVGSISKWLGISTLVTKEQQAEALATEAANAAMAKQTKTTEVLVTEIRTLTAAMQASGKVAQEMETLMTRAGTEQVASAEKTTAAVVQNEAEKRAAMTRTFEQQIAQAQAAAKVGQFSAVAAPTYSAGNVPAVGRNATDFRGASVYVRDEAATRAAQRAAEAEAAAMNQAAKARADQVNKTNSMLAVQNKVKDSVNGTSLAMGAMGAAMTATMVSSNAVVDSIAKWAMIGTMAVPALQAAGGAVATLRTGITDAIAGARTASTGITGMAGAMNVAKAGAIGFGAALNAALGPIGWIALGLTAMVGTFMAIKNHTDSIRAKQEALVQKQLDANEAMNKSTASIATNLGKAAGSYKQIIDMGGLASSGRGSSSQMLKSYNYYKGEEGSKELEALQSEGKLLDTDALMSKIQTKFIDLQVLGRDTAEQARTDVQAMLMAAGASSTQAMSIAEQVYEKYGDINKVDWAGPIRDQTEALTEMAREAFTTQTVWTRSGGIAMPIVSFEIDEGKKKLLYQQAEKSAEIFNQALADAANPAEARKLINQYMDAATSQWDVGFKNIMSSSDEGSDEARALFKKYGIDSGKAFAEGMRANGDFEREFEKLALDPNTSVGLKNILTQAKNFAIEYEHAFIKPLAEGSGYLSDNVLTAATALRELAAAGQGLTSDQAVTYLAEQNSAYKEYTALVQRVMTMQQQGVPRGSKEMLDVQNKLNRASKEAARVINELNQQYGFEQGRTAGEALNNLMMKVKRTGDGAKGSMDGLGDSADKAGRKAKDVENSIDSIPENKTVSIQVKQFGSIFQTAMSNVQDRMADSAMNSFNERWDNSMDAAQDSWDNRMDAMTERHDAAQRAMDARQEAAQRAFDNRWEKRKAAVEKEYQQRIDRIERQIKAEQNADDTRQRLFEKEKARLAALVEAENSDIDFNTQLNEGNLDEAAKTLNNAQAKTANDQMEAEMRAAEVRAQTRIAALEKKNERLEKQRDKELKQLEKMEERMRRHLERVQDARRRALEKQQADEAKALERSEEAAMASMERQRNYEEQMLEERLELFKAYTARNQKDLERWMKQVGLSYDDFGRDVKAKGENWAKHFRTELSAQIRQAGMEVMNDNIWEKVGKGMANKLLKGLGFDNLAEFNKFVKTGMRSGGKGKGGEPETRHAGGVVGSGGGSRKGVPTNYKGLHRSEKMIRAQKGEYVVNKRASSQHRDILDSINSGNYDNDGNRLPNTGGEFGNMGGLMAGAVSHMFRKGVEKAFQNNYQVGLRKEARRRAALSGGTFAGQAGVYGGRSFSAAQMRNAATIASVGSSMGMSKRDIMIGIMTAITESGLVNVNYGDRDSLGLFQQRPSMGWGTPAQVTDPKYASRAFFGPLKAHGERFSEAPWLAAQHIQRSAFSDGSNYRVWWDAAQAIFKNGLTRSSGGGVSGPGGGKGSGRYWRAADPGKGWVNSHDYGNQMRSPVYAIGPGYVRTEQLPPSAGSGQHPNAYPRGYGSYGVVSYLTTDDGKNVTYAHLYPGTQVSGRVSGGQRIALSASTGNSSGPHTHFEVNGSTNAKGAFESMGIALRTGGTIRHDDTLARLHQGETVLTAPLTQKFKDQVGSGGDTFNVTLDLRGAMIKEEIDIESAVYKAIDKKEAKLGRKRVVT